MPRRVSEEEFVGDALPTLERYARIPCLSVNFDAEWAAHGHLAEAAELFARWAGDAGLRDATVVVRTLPGRTPMVAIDVPATCDAAGTVVLYGHLDKQPPLGEWAEGLDPFLPVRRGDLVYGRGLADDGYALFSAVLAVRALQRDGIGHARCVILIEASEESGSPDLDAHLDELGSTLGDVDLLVCLDSGALTYDRLWVTGSLRGLVLLNLTVEVMDHGVHSGTAGGVVPSSFSVLRELLGRVEDPASGEVLVRALHAHIPDSHLAAAAVAAHDLGDPACADLPLVAGLSPLGRDGADRLLRRAWGPAMSVIGAEGIPPLGAAANLVRPSTTLRLGFRLPPSVNARDAAAALTATLTANPPHGARVSVVVDQAAQGWSAPELEPWLRAAVDAASAQAFGREPGLLGEGGSIPFLASLGERFPSVQFLATGVLGPNSNAHGPNESLHLPTAAAVTDAVATVLAAHAARRQIRGHHKGTGAT